MFGHRFYNQTTRKYIAAFGTLFNDIYITRKDNDVSVQEMKVPINYAPMQKFLALLSKNQNQNTPAIVLPRMSYEMISMTVDPTRKLSRMIRNKMSLSDDDNSFNTLFAPVPYNIEIQLNIMTKFFEDGTKILEQILPFFTPDFVPTIELLSDPNITLDIPIILNSVTHEDTYENSFEERRALIWTLNFTLQGYFFGPTSKKKVIKFIEVKEHVGLESTEYYSKTTIQPGLTANGEPTTELSETIPYQDINFTDNWGFIVRIENNE